MKPVPTQSSAPPKTPFATQSSSRSGARSRMRNRRGMTSMTERVLTYSAALNEALRNEMHRDPRVFLMGEDLCTWGDGGGVFGVTKGLVNEFGVDRVRDTPISEQGFVALGVGAAITGTRPVV